MEACLWCLSSEGVSAAGLSKNEKHEMRPVPTVWTNVSFAQMAEIAKSRGRPKAGLHNRKFWAEIAACLQLLG
ncbi:hypothetical protein NBRC116594_08650 [Shimia sp. NS0008-38b]